MITFWHELPSAVEIAPNRKVFTLNYARGKKVLHLGCVDTGVLQDRLDTQSHLHLHLMKVTERVWGVDVNREGIEQLQRMGIPDLFCANGEDLSALELGDQPDLIIAAEVLEHVSNPGLFLDSLRKFDCEILLTVPNAFSARGHLCMRSGKEFVHEDHNYYFSYVTLKALIEKHGFKLNRAAVYYWPSKDEIGEEMERLISLNPFFAEGLMFMIEPAAKQRWLVSDPESWEAPLQAYLEAARPGQDVALMLRFPPGMAESAQEAILGWLQRHGYDPEQIPDVLVMDEPLSSELFRQATAWIDTGDEPGRNLAAELDLRAIAPGEMKEALRAL